MRAADLDVGLFLIKLNPLGKRIGNRDVGHKVLGDDFVVTPNQLFGVCSRVVRRRAVHGHPVVGHIIQAEHVVVADANRIEIKVLRVIASEQIGTLRLKTSEVAIKGMILARHSLDVGALTRSNLRSAVIIGEVTVRRAVAHEDDDLLVAA